MKRLRAMLGQWEFHILLFAAGVILFVHPLLLASARVQPESLLRSLFIPWLVLIVLLFLAGLSYRAGREDGDQDV